MSGEELKLKLSSYGVNLSQLANSLGYDTDQRLHSNLKAADVKSGLIERIAKVLGKSISEIYGENQPYTHSSQSIVEKQTKIIESQQKTIDRLSRLLEQAS